VWWSWIDGLLKWIEDWKAARAERARRTEERRQSIESREQAKRDADDARARLNLDHAAETYRTLVDEMVERIEAQDRRIAALETEARATYQEMMRINIERAECKAETAAQKKEIEKLGREIESLKARQASPPAQ